MENLFESKETNLIMKEVSSLVTYGTSVNPRHNNGLWKIFQDYRLEKFSDLVAPLLIIWFCAHKSSLSWKVETMKSKISRNLKYADDTKRYFIIFR